jgi:hypothetical protein
MSQYTCIPIAFAPFSTLEGRASLDLFLFKQPKLNVDLQDVLDGGLQVFST